MSCSLATIFTTLLTVLWISASIHSWAIRVFAVWRATWPSKTATFISSMSICCRNAINWLVLVSSTVTSKVWVDSRFSLTHLTGQIPHQFDCFLRSQLERGLANRIDQTTIYCRKYAPSWISRSDWKQFGKRWRAQFDPDNDWTETALFGR